ncbi:methyltransferase [Colwelliaceae bacterium BS250]
MSLSNPSKLLLRSEELLVSNNPLVVGCPDSEFLNNLINIAPQATISSYHINFEYYQDSKTKYQDKVTTSFTENYQNSTGNLHDLVIIYFPKSKKEYQFMLAMLAPTLTTDATILVVGENKGGVKSCEKLSIDFSTICNKIDSARHCALYAISFNGNDAPFNFDDWYSYFDINVDGVELKIASLPGVFSHGDLDNGTRLLLEHLPSHISGKVLDFGCGAGIISAFVAKKFPQSKVELLDINALALASAKKTLELNQLTGRVFASNGLSEVKGQYQAVISNPPFHQGIKTNYQATETFLKQVKEHLSFTGTLTIVANNFLKYAPIIAAEISEPELLANKKGFAIHFCQKNI